MKFKNVVWTISEQDILSICKLFDKVNITRVEINNNILICGLYKVVGMNIDFEASITPLAVDNNILYVKLVDFKIGKKDITNPLVKKSINSITNSIASIDGIAYDSNIFKIELEKILNNICNETQKLNINDMNIESVKLINHELILNLGLASITILSLK